MPISFLPPKWRDTMTKYRLKIKYPIEEKDAKFIADNTKSLCWAYSNDGKEFDDRFALSGFPESWIEEIKSKSDFEEWLINDPRATVVPPCMSIKQPELSVNMDSIRDLQGYTWQIAQKKRDELYKPLIDSVGDFINELVTTRNLPVMPSIERINDSLTILKETLKSNGND
jgi:hypothetical protein